MRDRYVKAFSTARRWAWLHGLSICITCNEYVDDYHFRKEADHKPAFRTRHNRW